MNYNERVSKATELMRTEGVDIIILTRPSESRSLYYLTGVDRFCANYILHNDGSNILLILEQDLIDAEKKAHADEIKTFNTSKSQFKAILESIRKSGLKNGRVGVEKSFLRQSFYESLRDVLPKDFQIVDIEKITGQLRLIKSEEEIELIRKASEIASKTIQSTAGLIKPGVLENEIAATVEYELRKHGAEETATSTFISSGHRTLSAHPSASSRKLLKGDLVLLDVHPRIQGYCSDLAVTLTVEGANLKMIKYVRELQRLRDEVIQNVKVGEKISNIHLRFQQQLKKSGFIVPATPFFNNVHGIGVAANDPPSFWHPYDLNLQSGIVFAFAQAPANILHNKKSGIRFEDTYLVRDDKIEKLTTFQSK
ncbi:M24 family metallopeptidase [[Eubacterium] cellulosolvens]